MADEHRYRRLEDLLDLALRLRAAPEGLSIDDLMEDYGISRRTANRLLRAVRRVVGESQLVTGRDSDGRKRWRIAGPLAGGASVVLAEDLEALAAAVDAARSGGDPGLAERLERIQRRLSPLSLPPWVRPAQASTAARLEADGLGLAFGPAPRIDAALVDVIREAIATRTQVVLRQRARSSADGAEGLSDIRIGPLGFLLGDGCSVVGLVGRSSLRGGQQDVAVFDLAEIADVLPSRERFSAPPDFDLEHFAREARGRGESEVDKVVWRIRPAAAERARSHRFHPDQQLEPAADGSLLVRLPGGDRRSLLAEALRWAPDLEIVEPDSLRIELLRTIVGSLRLNGGGEIDISNVA